jgi:hypothetical protein
VAAPATRAIGLFAALAAFALARVWLASAYPWQRALDDDFFFPETIRWLAGGRLGDGATFARVPLWHLLLGCHLALFGRAGLLVLQGFVVLATCALYALWLGPAARRRAAVVPLALFLLSPQILLYSRQAANELFIGLLSVAAIVLGARRGPRAALALGVVVGTGFCTKPAALLLAILVAPALLSDRARVGASLARAAAGFALVTLPLLLYAGLERGTWLVDNTGAFNLSGMTIEEWRALPDPALRQEVGMERWRDEISNAPGAYLAGAGARAVDWLLRPSSADFAAFYPDYPIGWIAAADVAAFAILAALALLGSTRRDAAIWLYLLGWTLACAFPLFTPRSPKVVLMFPLLLLAARGALRLAGGAPSLASDASQPPPGAPQPAPDGVSAAVPRS